MVKGIARAVNNVWSSFRPEQEPNVVAISCAVHIRVRDEVPGHTRCNKERVERQRLAELAGIPDLGTHATAEHLQINSADRVHSCYSSQLLYILYYLSLALDIHSLDHYAS